MNGATWPKAVAKIVLDLDVLTAFYDDPAEHWIHLRTTTPIASTVATVRLPSRVTTGPGSRAAGVAMAFKLIESAEAHWRAVGATHLVALVRASAQFENGHLVERPDESGGDQQAVSPGRPCDRSACRSERPRQVRLLDGVGCMDGLRHAGWAGR